MVRLGQKVRDKITGFEGTAIARCEYLTGCVQFGVVPASADGKMPDCAYIDEMRLEVLQAPVGLGEVVELEPRAAAGGPQRDAPSARFQG